MAKMYAEDLVTSWKEVFTAQIERLEGGICGLFLGVGELAVHMLSFEQMKSPMRCSHCQSFNEKNQRVSWGINEPDCFLKIENSLVFKFNSIGRYLKAVSPLFKNSVTAYYP